MSGVVLGGALLAGTIGIAGQAGAAPLPAPTSLQAGDRPRCPRCPLRRCGRGARLSATPAVLGSTASASAAVLGAAASAALLGSATSATGALGSASSATRALALGI